MGRIRPKLSQAMQRELHVRRELGLGDTARKAKGRLGAARAAAELERRKRLARRKLPGWNSLVYEVQDMVLQHLSIKDLAAVREAGLGGHAIGNRERLRDVMLKRCMSVQTLWKIWTKGTPRYFTKVDRESCTPVEFTSQVAKLCLSPKADGVPESICEMKALKYLDVSRNHHSAFLGMPPALKTLPKSLENCQGLLEVKMSYHEFEEIPECVMTLKKLRRLEMEHNTHLKSLPEDMGHRLVSLNFLNIKSCRKIRKLPNSLLTRLEIGVSGRQRHKIPLLLSGIYFPNNYLVQAISSEKYPKLANYLSKGSLTGPEIVLDGIGADFPIFPDIGNPF